MNPLPAILLLCTAATLAADTRLAGAVRNTAGYPVTALTMHFYRRITTGFEHRTATTGADGKWSIDLPPGEWRGAASTDDLLARGYFCEPGFIWCGEAGQCDGGEWPGLWGPGLIVWDPVIDPGAVNLTVVPTRPDLSVEKPRTIEAGVKLTFETTAESMTTIRQWRVEKSTDLRTWTPMQTVALSGTSPVLVPDPASTRTPDCYYRAVQVEDIVAPRPPAP